MADNGLWFKLWCASLDDADLDNLDIADFGRWAKLGAYIKQHGQAGKVEIPAPARTLCAMFQVVDFSAFHAAVSRLPNVQIDAHERRVKMKQEGETTLTVSFTNWPKYQGDFSTNRVRKFREMKRSRGEEKRGDEMRGDEMRGDEKKDTYDVSSARQNGNHSALTDSTEAWLLKFITETQKIAPADYLNDSLWWENVALTCGGVDLEFLTVEFARMSAWLNENAQRKPASRTGWKKFIRTWLERSHEKTRRINSAPKAPYR